MRTLRADRTSERRRRKPNVPLTIPPINRTKQQQQIAIPVQSNLNE